MECDQLSLRIKSPATGGLMPCTELIRVPRPHLLVQSLHQYLIRCQGLLPSLSPVIAGRTQARSSGVEPHDEPDITSPVVGSKYLHTLERDSPGCREAVQGPHVHPTEEVAI